VQGSTRLSAGEVSPRGGYEPYDRALMSLPEFAGRNPIDVREPAAGVALEVEACEQREQALIGAIGDLDRQRGSSNVST